MKKLLTISLAALATTSTFAGGYRIGMQGQKQLAMGHTGVAVVQSAESTFFNPAGLSFLKDRFNVSVGGNYLFSHTKFQDTETNYAAQTKNSGTPFSVYASYRVTDWLTAAVGVYSPYGSTVEWDRDWAGSHLVNKIALQAIFIQPTIAIKVSDFFSFGGGPIAAIGSVEFDKNLFRDNNVVDDLGNRPNVLIEDSGIVKWGWTAGFMVNPTEKMRLGFNYRSEITMKAEGGKATFNNIPTYLAGQLQNTTFDASLPLPAEASVGASYQFTDKFLLAVDYNRTFWRAYDALNVEFATGLISENKRNYKDSNVYRVGAQYEINNTWTARAGWYYDESPVQDGYFAPETPRNDSHAVTAGFSYNFTDKLALDVSLMYLIFKEVDNSYDWFNVAQGGAPAQYSSFGGTYKNAAFTAGIGVSYKL